ncbi:hypothetical protein KIW84_056966 [Lathyrus oleraceus]|uniref:Uncharacterized protein n=1 Tax=Pisum sativum TaxID=3888 RepID=A0A9D5AKE3_PEA|nr:hypothetical protein KIW84_056966 [Pisum sativum]
MKLDKDTEDQGNSFDDIGGLLYDIFRNVVKVKESSEGPNKDERKFCKLINEVRNEDDPQDEQDDDFYYDQDDDDLQYDEDDDDLQYDNFQDDDSHDPQHNEYDEDHH